MPHGRLSVGSVRVEALLDGAADLPNLTVEDAFPDVPIEEHESGAGSGSSIYGADGRWRLFVRAWLVHHSAGTLLLDTGVGSTVAMEWFPEPGRLLDVLSEVGVAPHHIDTVAISHVHDDHIGGTVGADGNPAFPNARYVLQAADLQTARMDARESEEDAAIWERLLSPLESAGVLDTIDGHHRIGDELELRHAPGHTPGHQVLRVVSAGRRALLTGDAWNHPSQLGHPDRASATDREPALAAATRRTLLADLLSNPGTTIAPTHFAEPFGTVVTGPDGLATWSPLD